MVTRIRRTRGQPKLTDNSKGKKKQLAPDSLIDFIEMRRHRSEMNCKLI